MHRFHRWWLAALVALVLALPASAALAARLTPHAPARPHWIECQYTTETDNIQPSGNTFWDDLGNEWIAYYDLTRDSQDGAPCNMRVVVRIFNPAPDGSWHGTINVFAFMNGNYLSSSYGQTGGSCTYQYHFVWRGPWFGMYYGSFIIETNEFNGSSTYLRDYATFSV